MVSDAESLRHAVARRRCIVRVPVVDVADSGIQFRDNGVHALKGVPGDWRLYAVDGGRAP